MQSRILCGEGLAHFRKIKDIKQTDLDEYLDMSRQNLSNIENNKTHIKREKLVLAAIKLETTPERIIKYLNMTAISYNQNQQGPQYNNCHIVVSQELITGLQQALDCNRQILEIAIDLLKELKEGGGIKKVMWLDG